MKDGAQRPRRTGHRKTSREPVVRQIRASIARNCQEYAADAPASSSAMDLLLTLRRTATAFQTFAEGYTREHELSPTKTSIILTLAAAEGQTLPQAQIGRELFVSLGNLAGLLASLEDARLIKRRPAPNDGRVTNVSLTAKGATFVKRFAPFHYGIVAAAVHGMSRTEQDTLVELLDKMRDQLADNMEALAAFRKRAN